MSNTDANSFSEKDEGVSRIRRKKPRRNKLVTVSIIIAAAVLCLVIVYIILYKIGFRPYVRIETESGEKIKFSGMVDDSGNPIKGRLFYSDGSSANVNSETGEIVYSNGNVYSGTLVDLQKSGLGTLTFENGDVSVRGEQRRFSS